MLHDPSHYEPPPIAEEIRLSAAGHGCPPPAGLGVGRDRRAAGAAGKGAAVAAAQRSPVRTADGLDQRDLLARDERRRRADARHRASLGAGPGTRSAADALPVAASAGRHDRQRLPGLSAGDPQHRFRDHRRRGHRREPTQPATSSRGTSISRFATFDDLEKIKMPVVTHNEVATEFRYQAMCEVYDGILPVKKARADAHLVHALGLPDPLVGHRGGDDRPDRAARPGPRRRRADGRRLDGRTGPVRGAEPACPWTANNTRIGSGGYGYTDQLPGETSIPIACGRTTCGAARTPRSSRKCRRRCTGSSPSNTTCAGSSAGG